MKFLGSTKNKITKDKNSENVPHLEITNWNCDIASKDYQQDSRVLYTFVPNKPFGSLLEIFPTNHIFLKTFNSEYDQIIVWFTNQNSQPLEIEDRINITMVIKWRLYIYKWAIQLNQEIKYMLKDMDFCPLLKTWVKV